MSRTPSPGTYIPASVWSRTIKVPASMLSGPITMTSQAMQNANLTGSISVGDGLITRHIDQEWPVSEVDLLKDEVKKLTARVAELEDLTNKQHVAINELFSLVDQFRENAQNNSGQQGYQVAGLIASGYHGEKSW